MTTCTQVIAKINRTVFSPSQNPSPSNKRKREGKKPKFYSLVIPKDYCMHIFSGSFFFSGLLWLYSQNSISGSVHNKEKRIEIIPISFLQIAEKSCHFRQYEHFLECDTSVQLNHIILSKYLNKMFTCFKSQRIKIYIS